MPFMRNWASFIEELATYESSSVILKRMKEERQEMPEKLWEKLSPLRNPDITAHGIKRFCGLLLSMSPCDYGDTQTFPDIIPLGFAPAIENLVAAGIKPGEMSAIGGRVLTENERLGRYGPRFGTPTHH